MSRSPLQEKIHTYAILGLDGNDEPPQYQSVTVIK